MDIQLTKHQQQIKQKFEPLYQRNLTNDEVIEISRNIRGFFVTLFNIEKELQNENDERIQN